MLSSLVMKSLAATDHRFVTTRYTLLETARQYARERLVERGERDAVARRHALAYREAAERLEYAFFHKPDNELMLALGREEQDNWRAALQWTLIDRGDIPLGQRLVGELSPLWQWYAPVEGRRWLAAAQELVDAQTPTSVLAKLSYTEATIAMALNQNDIQLPSSKRAVAQYRDLGDPFGIALAQSREAQALLFLGRVAEAKPVLEEALPLARSSGNRWLIAWLLRLFSGSCEDLLVARKYSTEALQIYEALGSKLDVAYTMLGLSSLEFEAANPELAVAHTTNALALVRSLNVARAIVRALHSRTGFLVLLGRYEESESSARELGAFPSAIMPSTSPAPARLSQRRIFSSRIRLRSRNIRVTASRQNDQSRFRQRRNECGRPRLRSRWQSLRHYWPLQRSRLRTNVEETRTNDQQWRRMGVCQCDRRSRRLVRRQRQDGEYHRLSSWCCVTIENHYTRRQRSSVACGRLQG